MMFGGVILSLLISLPFGASHYETLTHNVLYYQPINLTCRNSHTDPSDISSPIKITWVLPGGEILRPGQKHDRVEIAASGHWLNVNRTNDEDFGVYNCLIFVNNQLEYNIQIGINIHGPYWGDLNAKYVPNMITAGVSCAIMFAVAAIMCFCYERQQGHGEDAIDAYDLKMMEMKTEDGKINKAYDEMEALPDKSPLPETEMQPSVVTKF